MKFTWRSILPSCYKGEYSSPQSTNTKIVATKASSFNRISLTDLSFPSATTTLSEDLSISLAGSNLYVFTLAELKIITQSFSSSNFLGEGGFGPVHKGFIDDKLRHGLEAQPVAVKLLDLDGSQGHKEWLVSASLIIIDHSLISFHNSESFEFLSSDSFWFWWQAEVVFLGQLRHHHLVKLIGYCCEEEHRLLVYEYLPRGSLENQLFRSKISVIINIHHPNLILSPCIVLKDWTFLSFLFWGNCRILSIFTMVNKDENCCWSCKRSSLSTRSKETSHL